MLGLQVIKLEKKFGLISEFFFNCSIIFEIDTRVKITDNLWEM